MTIPDEAVRAAQEATEGGFGITDDYMHAALTAALPFLQGVKDAPNLTRPLIGIENRTAQEVFDIMCDRILSAIEPSPSPRAQALEEALAIVEKYDDLVRNSKYRQAKIHLKVNGLSFLRALSSQPVADRVQCERCQGNGEIVTDWDRYKHPNENDVGDEAVTECPDCSGYGFNEAKSQPVADGWLPIETAPKDGTAILAVCEGIYQRTGDPFIPEVVEWTEYGWNNEMWGEEPNHGGFYPTHWRPLPASPGASE